MPDDFRGGAGDLALGGHWTEATEQDATAQCPECYGPMWYYEEMCEPCEKGEDPDDASMWAEEDR